METQEIFMKLADPKWQIRSSFRGRDIISVVQFDHQSINAVLETADALEAMDHAERSHILAGRSIAVLFYQPSTRTYTSFIQAGQKLGADVLGIHGMTNYSSAYKGESLPDTLRTVEALDVNLVALRHFEDDSALVAASNTNIPIINAGSGKLEHPTQALLDVRTIIKESGRPDPQNLHIGFIGDLKYGRTVHSLSELMAIMGTKRMSCIAPDVLKMPRSLVRKLEDHGVEVFETNNIDEVIGDLDVLYVTRVQREWFKSEEDYEKARLSQQITPELMAKARASAVLMHPLPRVDEIVPEVDADSRAAYFRQVRHGLYVRMALLKLVLGGDE
jgi:aspartate carbamoyltransferase